MSRVRCAAKGRLPISTTPVACGQYQMWILREQFLDLLQISVAGPDECIDHIKALRSAFAQHFALSWIVRSSRLRRRILHHSANTDRGGTGKSFGNEISSVHNHDSI